MIINAFIIHALLLHPLMIQFLILLLPDRTLDNLEKDGQIVSAAFCIGMLYS